MEREATINEKDCEIERITEECLAKFQVLLIIHASAFLNDLENVYRDVFKTFFCFLLFFSSDGQATE